MLEISFTLSSWLVVVFTFFFLLFSFLFHFFFISCRIPLYELSRTIDYLNLFILIIHDIGCSRISLSSTAYTYLVDRQPALEELQCTPVRAMLYTSLSSLPVYRHRVGDME